MYITDKEFDRLFHAKKHEALGELEHAKRKILEELSNVDGCTLNQIRGILETYQKLETSIINKMNLFESKVNSFIKLNSGQIIGDIGSGNTHFVTPQDFNAVGDGLADDTESFKLAISSAYEKGILYIPKGTYKITETLNIIKPLKIIGVGWGDSTDNPNGSGIGISTIKWCGGENPVFKCMSDIIDNYLFGVDISNILIDGGFNATNGIELQSTTKCEISKIQVRYVKNNGIYIGCENGVLSQFNVIRDYDFVYGYSDQCSTANGIRIGSDENTLTTQTHIEDTRMLINKGNGIHIKNSDNNQIFKSLVYCIGENGNGLYFDDNAFQNYVIYFCGKIHNVATAKGNIVEHHVSENGGITIEDGGSLTYSAIDYINNKIYNSPSLLTHKTIHLSCNSFECFNGAEKYLNQYNFTATKLPKTTNNSCISTIINPISEIGEGSINYIKLIYSTELNTGSAKIKIKITNNPPTGWMGNNLSEYVVELPPSETNANILEMYVPIIKDISPTDIISLLIYRDYNDSGINEGYVSILGVEMLTHYTGSLSGGSYSLPPIY